MTSQDYIDQINDTGDAYFSLDPSRIQATVTAKMHDTLTIQPWIHYAKPDDASVKWYQFRSIPRK